MPTAIFSHVSARYGRGPTVLHDINFRLEAGSYHVLTGPSGAGKSTLLKMLYLAHKPCSGGASLFGQDLMRLRRNGRADLRRRIGVVFQDYRLLDHLTAFENVSLPLRLQGLVKSSYAEDVVELLTWVGLGDRANAYPPTLSGGERQRVAIARAIVAKPQLIVADEPTGSVDPEMGQRLMRLFTELNKLGATLVIATHDPTMALQVGAQAWHIQDGQLHHNTPTPDGGPVIDPYHHGGAS